MRKNEMCSLHEKE